MGISDKNNLVFACGGFGSLVGWDILQATQFINTSATSGPDWWGTNLDFTLAMQKMSSYHGIENKGSSLELISYMCRIRNLDHLQNMKIGE